MFPSLFAVCEAELGKEERYKSGREYPPLSQLAD